MEKFRQKYREFSLDPSGFHEFVRWLDQGGLSNNGHWNLQSRQLCFQLEHYDAIVRFENYQSEVYDFLIDAGVPADRFNLTNSSIRGRHHKTDADKKLQSFYDANTQKLVRKMFETDFELLGYDDDLQFSRKPDARIV